MSISYKLIMLYEGEELEKVMYLDIGYSVNVGVQMHVLDGQFGFSLSSTIVFVWKGWTPIPCVVLQSQKKKKKKICLLRNILFGFYRRQTECCCLI